jgi:hypothetical protein
MKNMNNIKLILLLFSFLLSGCFGDEHLKGDYYLSNGDMNYLSIYNKKNKVRGANVTVIDKKILDYTTKNKYLLVSRQVTEFFECKDEKGNEKFITTIYYDMVELIILDTESDVIEVFTDQKKFDARLKELGIYLFFNLKTKLYSPSNINEKHC